MTIHKAKDFIEAFRAKALAKDINELTGRPGRPDLTQFVIDQLASKISFKADSIVVDIGCGDGMFLRKAAEHGVDGFKGRLIGILPTEEEVCRVREHLLGSYRSKNNLISIELGTLDKLNLPTDFADIVVSNSTFQYLENQPNVVEALREINRITKRGGVILFGEILDADEMAGKNYGDSITAWLFWVLKNQGMNQFTARLKQTLAGLLSGEPLLIYPKKMFFMPPQDFMGLLAANGFQILEHYRHQEIDSEGVAYDRATRWNYLATKV